jgi:predicted ferric reductase
MIDFIASMPIWQIIRSLGIVSYIFLTAGICFGMAYNFPIWRKRKAALYKLHTFSTITGTGLGLLHGAITVIDQYTPFTWSEVLFPFTASYAPFLTGIGTLSGYGLLFIILTSDLRNKIKKKIWLAIHMTSYPVFIMAFIHGYFLGTDSNIIGIRLIYFMSIALVISLTAIRMTMPASKRNNNTNLKSTV